MDAAGSEVLRAAHGPDTDTMTPVQLEDGRLRLARVRAP
jgi:hypothetical protein